MTRDANVFSLLSLFQDTILGILRACAGRSNETYLHNSLIQSAVRGKMVGYSLATADHSSIFRLQGVGFHYTLAHIPT